jgi:hypothetical protein
MTIFSFSGEFSYKMFANNDFVFTFATAIRQRKNYNF